MSGMLRGTEAYKNQVRILLQNHCKQLESQFVIHKTVSISLRNIVIPTKTLVRPYLEIYP